jgi:hypothetical protein
MKTSNRGRKPGPFPAGWHYKEPMLHEQHIAFLRQKAQAKFRNEPWDLTIEEYFKLWTPELWVQRGRKATDLCMIRIDTNLAWRTDNVEIVERYYQLTVVQGKIPRRKQG